MPDTLYPTTHVRLGSNAGQPMTRREGVAKVTGAATYAADNRPDGMLHAVIASAGIARGRVGPAALSRGDPDGHWSSTSKRARSSLRVMPGRVPYMPTSFCRLGLSGM